MKFNPEQFYTNFHLNWTILVTVLLIDLLAHIGNSDNDWSKPQPPG
jgi:hypothetical protein